MLFYDLLHPFTPYRKRYREMKATRQEIVYVALTVKPTIKYEVYAGCVEEIQRSYGGLQRGDIRYMSLICDNVTYKCSGKMSPAG